MHFRLQRRIEHECTKAIDYRHYTCTQNGCGSSSSTGRLVAAVLVSSGGVSPARPHAVASLLVLSTAITASTHFRNIRPPPSPICGAGPVRRPPLLLPGVGRCRSLHAALPSTHDPNTAATRRRGKGHPALRAGCTLIKKNDRHHFYLFKTRRAHVTHRVWGGRNRVPRVSFVHLIFRAHNFAAASAILLCRETTSKPPCAQGKQHVIQS